MLIGRCNGRQTIGQKPLNKATMSRQTGQQTPHIWLIYRLQQKVLNANRRIFFIIFQTQAGNLPQCGKILRRMAGAVIVGCAQYLGLMQIRN